MRRFALLAALAALIVIPAAAQIADPDTLYDAGSISFDYVQTPFPNYSGTFAAEGDGLNPDGTWPPGVTEAVGGGSAIATLDTVATVLYGAIANADGTFDSVLVALKTIGPLTAGTYPVDITNGTAIFGFIDDAENFDLPDTLDNDSIMEWLLDLPAAHKLISASGSIQVAGVSADTLYGTFSGTTVDLDNSFFFVNVNDGQFALSGADVHTAALDTPVAAPVVRAWPNPFNPRTSVVFSLPEAGSVEAVVYDLAGRRVRTLHRGVLVAGEHRLQWAGGDERGDRVAAGVYLVRVVGGDWQRSVKVTLAP